MSSTPALREKPKKRSRHVRRSSWRDSAHDTVTKVFNAACVVAAQVMLLLQSAHCVGPTSFKAAPSPGVSVTKINEVVGRSDGDVNVTGGPDGTEILDWAQAAALPVRVSPASSQVTLRGDRTYLLVGMAGDLGQSVCHWMITRGARNIVLASRTPNVDEKWIDEMVALRARVRVESM